MRFVTLAVFLFAVFAPAVRGQPVVTSQPALSVEWPLADGGNGHWYELRLVPEDVTWFEAQAEAFTLGGHLATVTSAEEDRLVRGLATDVSEAWQQLSHTRAGPWLGGFRSGSDAPADQGWRWITGEPFEYGGWDEAHLDRARSSRTIHLFPSGWDDVTPRFRGKRSFIVEYPGGRPHGPSKDLHCQWKRQDGGNGHWYVLVIRPEPVSWLEARAMAEDAGGHLATLTSAEESAVAYALAARFAQAWDEAPGAGGGPWIGLRQSTGAGDPANGWRWVTGESLSFNNWQPGQPDDGNRREDCAHLHEFGQWNDVSEAAAIRAYLLELPEDRAPVVAEPELEWKPLAASGDDGHAAAVEQYFALVSEGKYELAIRRWWDVDRFLSLAFTHEYDRMDRVEQRRLQGVFIEALTAILTREGAAEAMRGASLQRFSVAQADRNDHYVRFLAGGEQGRENTVRLQRRSVKPRIVDARVGDQPWLSRRLGALQRASGQSPGEFIQSMRP